MGKFDGNIEGAANETNFSPNDKGNKFFDCIYEEARLKSDNSTYYVTIRIGLWLIILILNYKRTTMFRAKKSLIFN